MDKIPIQFAFEAAFLKLQQEIKPAIKDAKNPAFKSKYADLGAVWDAIREPLHDNGFAVLQSPQFDGDTMFLETILMHTSGNKVVSRYPLRPIKLDPQGYGSAITYARRYSLSAMLGVITEDDDGNAASGHGNGNGHKPPPAQEPNGFPDQRNDAPEPDPDIRAGSLNWVEKQEARILACTDMEQLNNWLNIRASYNGRPGNWDRPTPGSDLDKTLKHFPDLFKRLRSYYMEKLREV